MFKKYVRPTTTTPKPILVTYEVGDSQDSPESDSGTTILCINFPKLWKNTKQEAETFVTGVWNKLSSIFST